MTAHGLHPAHLLFLYDLLAKNGFYTIKLLKKNQKKNDILWHVKST